MCLQWCHVQFWLLNNDLPCWFCEYGGDGWPERPDQRCASCWHNQGDHCALTMMALPSSRTCCHWNAARTPDEVLELTNLDVAPGTLETYAVGSVAELFATSPTAPPYTVQDGRVRVRLDDLAVPWVYGIGASAWEHCLAESGERR
jgi:hypothetical protein